MVSYQNGKIYKLVCGDLIYVGSTCSDLKTRLYYHKLKSNICKSKILFESGEKVEIFLVEKYPCNDRDELKARERYYIEKFGNKINQRIPGRTASEWEKNNKEHIKEYVKNNKELINKRRREYRLKNLDKINQYMRKHREVKRNQNNQPKNKQTENKQTENNIIDFDEWKKKQEINQQLNKQIEINNKLNLQLKKENKELLKALHKTYLELNKYKND